MRSSDRLHRLALGITRQVICRDLADARQYARRAPLGIFVEVEAQSLPPRQWRMILVHLQHGFARAKHLDTSLAPTRHGRAGPRSQPVWSPPARSRAFLRW